MDNVEGLELSPKKVIYLKYLVEHAGTVKTNDLAAHFNVDPSTISKTVSELAEFGYLTYTPYHGVTLSEKGKKSADFLVKRHRILSLMLTHYGLSSEQACKEVSRFESLVSKEAIERMCHAMGHPQKGVCGEITHNDQCYSCGADIP